MAQQGVGAGQSGLGSVWDYMAYGAGAAGAAWYEFHSGSHNYLGTVNAAGMAAVPARRAAAEGINNLWLRPRAKELQQLALEAKVAAATTFFNSNLAIPSTDLVAELNGYSGAWQKKLIADPALESAIESLVVRYLSRVSSFSASLANPTSSAITSASSAPRGALTSAGAQERPNEVVVDSI